MSKNPTEDLTPVKLGAKLSSFLSNDSRAFLSRFYNSSLVEMKAVAAKLVETIKNVAENHYDICCYMLTYDVWWLTGATFADSRDSVHLVRKYTTVFFLLAAFTEGNSR